MNKLFNFSSDFQPLAILSNKTNLADSLANLVLIGLLVFSVAKRTVFFFLSAVNRCECSGTDVEGIELVVIQLMFVRGSFIACLK